MKAYRITIRRNGRTIVSLHLSGLSSALKVVRRLRSAWEGHAIHLARV